MPTGCHPLLSNLSCCIIYGVIREGVTEPQFQEFKHKAVLQSTFERLKNNYFQKVSDYVLNKKTHAEKILIHCCPLLKDTLF